MFVTIDRFPHLVSNRILSIISDTTVMAYFFITVMIHKSKRSPHHPLLSNLSSCVTWLHTTPVPIFRDKNPTDIWFIWMPNRIRNFLFDRNNRFVKSWLKEDSIKQQGRCKQIREQIVYWGEHYCTRRKLTTEHPKTAARNTDGQTPAIAGAIQCRVGTVT